MNNLQTNALRIAELMGWSSDDEGADKTFMQVFSSYNGLMPIVFECNSRKECQIIEIGLNQVSIIYVNYADFTSEVYTNQFISEPEFVEALQLAVIKYLELKNG